MYFRRFAAAAALAGTLFAAHGALAWGATGHRLIGRLAAESLPAEVPAFLKTPRSIEALGELAREPDRGKGAGREHDSDRDSAHFLDLGDDGAVFGGPRLDALPPTREAYDGVLRAVNADSWKAGWLPYAIVDSWEQLAKDLAYVRVETWAAKHTADPKRRAWYGADLARRQDLTLRDLGELAHYVGDGSQPLHVSAHFNGWGDYPNPEHFTQDRLHARFEGQFVHDFIDAASVKADMTPFSDCDCTLPVRVARYLAATNAQVAPLYRLEKDDAFIGGDKAGKAFVSARLAAGASELRDLIVIAWRVSAHESVGWPAINPADVEAGKVDPWDSVYGAD